MTRRLALRLLSGQMGLRGLAIWKWNFDTSGRRLVYAICGRRVARRMREVHLAV